VGSLSDRVAIVTGAARGQGAAIAERYAREGAVVVRRRPGRHGVASSLPASPAGHESLAVLQDVSDTAGMEAVVDDTVRRFGSLDIMVNNAGVVHPPFEVLDSPDELYDQIFSVNVEGVLIGSRAAGRVMRDQRRGRIINTASQAGKVALRNLGVYNASKAAVILLTQTLALELAAYNVSVNAICPGTMMTQMARDVFGDLAAQQGTDLESYIRDYAATKIPAGRLGAATETAALATWLASDESSFTTGAAINLTGGEQVFF
jgi:NAD(P)-dependent dehydrogenase (short-subunit alcohol dehydrogenase family)